jgi:hypothetical protein
MTLACRDNGKRPRNDNVGGNGNEGKNKLDEPEEGSKDKSKSARRGKGKGKGYMRSGRWFNFNAIVKALTPKEHQQHIGEPICYKCHKPGHRMSKCLKLKREPSNKVDKQDLWWLSCPNDGQEQPATTIDAHHAPISLGFTFNFGGVFCGDVNYISRTSCNS